MSKFKFYLNKADMLLHFIWWWEWALVREEWNLTYEGMLEAQSRSDKICREAEERLRKAIEEHK